MIHRGMATLALAAALLLLPAAAPAQDMKTGLQEAFDLALKDNPRLVAARSALQAGKARAAAARSYLLPTVTLEERYMKTDNPTFSFSSKLNQGRFEAADFAIDRLNDPDAIDDFTTSVSFEQALYSREASLGAAIAGNASRALELDYQRVREEVLLQVVEAFIAHQTAKGHLEVARKAVEDAETHLGLARSRVEAGLGLESDMLRAEVSLKESEERLVSARKNVSLAARSLGLVLGRESAVEADEGAVREPVLEDLSYYEEAARGGRSDLLAMAKRVDNARLNISMARAPYSPTVGLGGSYQLNSHQAPFDEENSSYQVTAFVRWDLYSGGKRGHAVAEAGYGLTEAQALYDGMKKEIGYQVHEAYLSVLEAARAAELASSRLSLAEETARLIETRYENSLATLVELLDAQTALDSARANHVAKTKAHLVALARLMSRSGLIEQEYLARD